MDLTQKYQQREESLRVLGFSSYEQYLSSPIWYFLRKMVMKSSRGMCRGCYINKATQVHHMSYSPRVLLGHRLEKLVPVCAMCHEMAHGK